MSASQIKQIGGRAGRYGLHGDSSDGGMVTTLFPADLPVVEAAMSSDLPPLPGAVLPISFNTYNAIQRVVDVGESRFTDVLDTISLFSRTRHPYIHGEDTQNWRTAELLDSAFDHLTIDDTITWFLSPVSWKDDVAKAVARRFLKDHLMRMRVSLTKVIGSVKLLWVLEKTCSEMKTQRRTRNPRTTLMALETLHRSITLYMWMGQRLPIVFADLEEALELKGRTEKAMEFVLKGMTRGVKARNLSVN